MPVKQIDLLDFLGLQVKAEDVQIFLHMLGIRRAREQHHLYIESEPEHDLVHGTLMAFGDPLHFRIGERRAIRGEQRESLIGDLVGHAQITHFAIPATLGITSILDKGWAHTGGLAKSIELFACDVAYAQEAHSSPIVNCLHRSPSFPIH